VRAAIIAGSLRAQPGTTFATTSFVNAAQAERLSPVPAPTPDSSLAEMLRTDELREEVSTVLHLGMRYFGFDAAALTEVAGDMLVVHARRTEVDASFPDVGPPGLSLTNVLGIHDSSSAGWDHGRRLRTVGVAAYIGAPIQIRGRTVAVFELTSSSPRAPFNQSDVDMVVSLVRWLEADIRAVVTTPALVEVVPRISGIRSVSGPRSDGLDDLPSVSNDWTDEASHVGRSSGSSWQNLFIVVIDPCAAMAHTVTPLLFDRGHRVFVATSYEQGISFAREYRPDVVLIDARPEDPSALEAVERIRASDDPGIAGVPIVAACGRVLPDYADRCRAAGVTEYCERPLRTREMVATVEAHGPYAKAC